MEGKGDSVGVVMWAVVVVLLLPALLPCSATIAAGEARRSKEDGVLAGPKQGMGFGTVRKRVCPIPHVDLALITDICDAVSTSLRLRTVVDPKLCCSRVNTVLIDVLEKTRFCPECVEDFFDNLDRRGYKYLVRNYDGICGRGGDGEGEEGEEGEEEGGADLRRVLLAMAMPVTSQSAVAPPVVDDEGGGVNAPLSLPTYPTNPMPVTDPLKGPSSTPSSPPLDHSPLINPKHSGGAGTGAGTVGVPLLLQLGLGIMAVVTSSLH